MQGRNRERSTGDIATFHVIQLAGKKDSERQPPWALATYMLLSLSVVITRKTSNVCHRMGACVALSTSAYKWVSSRQMRVRVSDVKGYGYAGAPWEVSSHAAKAHTSRQWCPPRSLDIV